MGIQSQTITEIRVGIDKIKALHGVLKESTY